MERRTITREGLLGAGRNLAKGLSLVAAVIFVAAFTTNLLSERTGRLDGLDLAIGHVEMLKLESSLAVITADDVQAGRSQPEVAAAAIDRLGETLKMLQPAMADAQVSGLGEIEASVESLVVALESRDVFEAGRIAADRVGPTVEGVATDLLDRRTEVLAELNTISSLTGAGAVGAGAVMVFFVPVGLIFGIRGMARRQMERTERQVRDEASRDLVHSKDQFIAGLSHELRTPLTAVVGFAQILEEFDGTSEESIEIARAIGHQGSELARMVEDLIVAARLDVELASFRLAELDPQDVVDQTLGMIPNSERFTIDVEEGVVLADAARLRHVLRNLVANAQSHGLAPFRIEGRPTSDGYVITVADRGRGLGDSAQQSMFKRFVHDGSEALTTGSVGLGLHVAGALAEGMDGTLRYRRVEEWTLFQVVLPVPIVSKATRMAIDA